MISVVVPLRNSAQHVPPLLASLRALDRGEGGAEFILVENGSSDDTWRCLQTACAATACFRPIRARRAANAYAARNVGIEAAQGSVVAFTDADCRPAPAWLTELRRGFQSPGIDLLAGAISPGSAENWIDRFSARFGTLSQRHTLRGRSWRYGQTANLAVRRSVLRELGSFDDSLESGGDADLCWRAQAAGLQLRFAPSAIVLHRHRTTLGGLWEQWARYGRGRQVLRRLHGAPLAAEMRVSSLLRLLVRRGGLPSNSTALADSANDGVLAAWCCAAFCSGVIGAHTGANRLPWRQRKHGAAQCRRSLLATEPPASD